jgi:hypothetical protein
MGCFRQVCGTSGMMKVICSTTISEIYFHGKERSHFQTYDCLACAFYSCRGQACAQVYIVPRDFRLMDSLSLETHPLQAVDGNFSGCFRFRGWRLENNPRKAFCSDHGILLCSTKFVGKRVRTASIMPSYNHPYGDFKPTLLWVWQSHSSRIIASKRVSSSATFSVEKVAFHAMMPGIHFRTKGDLIKNSTSS